MKMDTDLDGMTDGMEVHFGANPLVAAGSPMGSPLGSPMGSTLPAGPDPAELPDDDHALGLDAGADIH
jgi:hypothetical protein